MDSDQAREIRLIGQETRMRCDRNRVDRWDGLQPPPMPMASTWSKPSGVPSCLIDSVAATARIGWGSGHPAHCARGAYGLPAELRRHDGREVASGLRPPDRGRTSRSRPQEAATPYLNPC